MFNLRFTYHASLKRNTIFNCVSSEERKYFSPSLFPPFTPSPFFDLGGY
jgi:hypothetical protein